MCNYCGGPRVDSRCRNSLSDHYQSEEQCGIQDWKCGSESKRNHWRCRENCWNDKKGSSFGSEGRVHPDEKWSWKRDERKKVGTAALWKACAGKRRSSRQTFRSYRAAWSKIYSKRGTFKTAWSQSGRTQSETSAGTGKNLRSYLRAGKRISVENCWRRCETWNSKDGQRAGVSGKRERRQESKRVCCQCDSEMCSWPCSGDYDFSRAASKWWDERKDYRTRGTKHQNSWDSDRCRAYHWWYTGGSCVIRIWSDPKRSCPYCSWTLDRGWTYPSCKNWRDGGKSTERSRFYDSRRRRGSSHRGWCTGYPSGIAASAWTYEIQNKLRTECAEAFHRGCSVVRTSGRRDRAGCAYGEKSWTSARHR